MTFPFPNADLSVGGSHFVGSDESTQTSGSGTSYNQTLNVDLTGSNEVVVIFVANAANTAVTHTDVKLDGTSGTKIGQWNVDGGLAVCFSGWWWPDADLPATSGDKTVAVTISASLAQFSATSVLVELQDIHQTVPFGTPVTDTATDQTGHTYTLSVSGESGEFILSCVAAADSLDIDAGRTAPANTTEVQDIHAVNGSRSTALAVGYDESAASSPETYPWDEDETNELDSLSGVAIPVYAV
jgi:hypothetical protein